MDEMDGGLGWCLRIGVMAVFLFCFNFCFLFYNTFLSISLFIFCCFEGLFIDGFYFIFSILLFYFLKTRSDGRSVVSE